MHGMKPCYFMNLYITKSYNAYVVVAGAISILQNCLLLCTLIHHGVLLYSHTFNMQIYYSNHSIAIKSIEAIELCEKVRYFK